MSKLTQAVGGGDNLMLLAALAAAPVAIPAISSLLGAGAATGGSLAASGAAGAGAGASAAGSVASGGLGQAFLQALGGVGKQAAAAGATNALVNAATPQPTQIGQIPQQQLMQQIQPRAQSANIGISPAQQLLQQLQQRSRRQG